MKHSLQLLGVAVAFSFGTLLPITSKATPPNELDYRLYVKVARILPNGQTVPMVDAYVDSDANHEPYAPFFMPDSDKSAGFGIKYKLRAGDGNKIIAHLMVDYEDRYVTKEDGKVSLGSLRTVCDSNKNCIQIPNLTKLNFQQDVELTPGENLEVPFIESKGNLLFVYNIEPLRRK